VQGLPEELRSQLAADGRASLGPGTDDTLERLRSLLEANPETASRAIDDPLLARALIAVVRFSRAMTTLLVRYPDWSPSPASPPPEAPDDPDEAAVRRFVQGRLVRTAVRDLLGLADMPTVGRELADTADAAAGAALTIATGRADARHHPPVHIPFGVIAMGKWGAQELNYASDIDVLFVYDTPDGTDPDLARDYAGTVAAGFIAALADVTADGIAYRVDADLRPEGRNGPLARSLDSYATYYERWAHTWEYQSLIKARPAAGDPTLTHAFTTLITPHIYPDTLPPDTIRNIRTMKARIEDERLPRDATFHLKLGPGGLSDVEFFTQLLQMRHGAAHPSLRVPGTVAALRELEKCEILTHLQTKAMIDAYEFCARVRNRLFLQLGRPTDTIPIDVLQGVRLGRSLGYEESPRSSLREQYRRITRRARKLIDAGFYHDL
jgi:glutamate-ammonia-ligase adenylyltransferase